MANLLPPERRRRIERERWIRMATVGCMFLSALCALALISLIPSLLLSNAKGENTERQVALVQEFIALQEKSGVADVVRKTKHQLELLGRERTEIATIELLTLLAENTGPGVTLSRIRFEVREEDPRATITGFAATRDALLTFVGRLEGEDRIKEIDLPISNLAQSADIEFIFTALLADNS